MYMQNVSDDMYWNDDSYLLMWIYSSLLIVYMFMNSRMEWDHSANEETFTNCTEVELKYSPVALEIIDDEWNTYERCLRWFKFNKWNNTYCYELKWKKIKFNSEKTSVTIFYKRLPNPITKEDLSSELDIPDSLIATVLFYTSYQILPSHYSEWAQLAQNYQNTALTLMNEYITAYWFTTGDTSFIS